MEHKLHKALVLAVWESEGYLSDNAMAKPKRTLLPILIVLFLISYGLMCLLVVEQARTMENQRTLIRQLLGDSTQLSAMKGKEVQRKHAEAEAQAEAQAQAEAKARSQAQTPPSQVHPRENAKSEHEAGRLRRPAPQKPPRNTADGADARRALIAI